MELKNKILANDTNYVACPSCDQMADVSSLKHGERAKCSRCNHFLTEYKADSVERVIAYAFSSLILLLLASSGPFLSFQASGLESIMTLPGTVVELYRYGMTDLAVLVAAFIIVIPLIIIVLLLVLYIPLHFNRCGGESILIARLIFTLEEWSMVEVFLIGVIVSLVKIAAMATVILGLSFWAYFAFTVCFTLTVSNLDRLQCWSMIERITEQEKNGKEAVL